MNHLLKFSDRRPPQWKSFLVCSMVDEICEALAPRLEAQCIELDIDIPPNTVVTADQELFRLAVLKLMTNALDAMPLGGNLVVTSYQHSRGFEIEVADSGSELTKEVKKQLASSYNSTIENQTGLALSVVLRMAKEHGGTVIAESCPEGGAAFTIRIPRHNAMEAAA